MLVNIIEFLSAIILVIVMIVLYMKIAVRMFTSPTRSFFTPFLYLLTIILLSVLIIYGFAHIVTSRY